MTSQGTCDIGLIGLAVMGENLALNIASRGFGIAVYNRTGSVTDAFTSSRGKQPEVVGCHTLPELVAALKPPRKVMMMVKAGPAVDELIKTLVPLLSKGDVIIDGGNTLYSDTERRTREVEAAGLLYVGSGVSGGEEGALKGPSLMPGGSKAAWPLVQPIFQAIAAKVGPRGDIPCCDWVGPRGAGHYVKMVHNGIEYGDMQLICEAYSLLKHGAGLSNPELAKVFDDWNRGELNSYLIEITRDIFTVKDPDTGGSMVDLILDRAGAKGTGKWMSQLALDLGVPSTLVTEAVYARCLSALKESRVRASRILTGPDMANRGDKAEFVEQVRQALYASKIASYAQGYVQLAAAAKEHDWPLDYGAIAMMWRGGCIIRAQFLERIFDAYKAEPGLENLMLAPYFTQALANAQRAWRHVIATAAT
ncbi:MAG: NADP-dependent phosphogluconate dehydrogenase, partial [Planctomycetia bacterium]|nr:NADP-dependent phosphogluconate dehydrogenase [Planctomycetia bacterium]